MGILANWRKRLLVRGLRRHVDLDECQRKALSILDADHLRAFNSALRRLHDYADPGPRARVIPLLSRDIALARLMNQTSFDKVRGVCGELLDLHTAALSAAKTDGSFAKLCAKLSAEIASMLVGKIPANCRVVEGNIVGAVVTCLDQGWSPQVAGGIVIHQIFANPLRFVSRIDPPSSYQSSAPYRVSRSEMRR